MKHCVALYAPQVSGGRAVIVGLNVLGERTTVEIDRDSIEIRQHKGIGNATPSPLMDRALATMIKKWQRAKREGLSA